MEIRDEFRASVAILKSEREKANLKNHLATMESQKNLEQAEEKWGELNEKISVISDGFVVVSDEEISKIIIATKELIEIYKRISECLRERC